MLLAGFHILQLLLCFVVAQTVPHDPTFDCTNSNFQVIYAACNAKDYTHCCALGTDCCAGGCCDLLSSCVGQGTSKETCCDVGDPTLCGTGPALPLASVLCSGSSGLSNYYCPHGSTCNIHDDTCYLPATAASSTSIKASSTAIKASSTSSSRSNPETVTSTEEPASATEVASTTVVVTAAASSKVPGTTKTATSTPGSVSISVVTVTPSPTAVNISSKTTAIFNDGYYLILGVASIFILAALL